MDVRGHDGWSTGTKQRGARTSFAMRAARKGKREGGREGGRKGIPLTLKLSARNQARSSRTRWEMTASASSPPLVEGELPEAPSSSSSEALPQERMEEEEELRVGRKEGGREGEKWRHHGEGRGQGGKKGGWEGGRTHRLSGTRRGRTEQQRRRELWWVAWKKQT